MKDFSDFAPHPITVGERRFELRRAIERDLPQLISLLRDDVLGAGREGGDGAEVGPYRRAFERIDADPGQLLVSVVEVPVLEVPAEPASTSAEELPIIGTLQLTLIPSLSRRGSLRLQIEAVRIARAAQGLGLGHLVFEWAHDYGRSLGAGLAQLTTDKTRIDAQRFYARLGYAAGHEGLKLELG